MSSGMKTENALHDKKMVTAMEATRMDIGVAISCRTKRRYQEDEGWKI